jgi:hypothetical protein
MLGDCSRVAIDWDDLFASAGAELRAAAKKLAERGVHLTVGHLEPGGARLRLDLLSAGPFAIYNLENSLGVPGLALLAQAIPIDRVEALRAAVRDHRAAYYADPVVFVGAALRAWPALEGLLRGISRTVGLGGAAVAPTGSGGVAVIVGAPVDRTAVDSLSRWAMAL